MAKGAKHRKAQSAIDGTGGGVRRTSSYQPQTALPNPATSADPANSSQETRSAPVNVRALRTLETAASAAAPASPKSPMMSATARLEPAPTPPQCRAAPSTKTFVFDAAAPT